MSSVGDLLSVDPDAATPPFEQVRTQLSRLIETGQLVTGESLPPVRRLAADLGLAVNTVARAYKELEAAALVTTRRGAGTRVAPRTAVDASLVEEAAQEYLGRAKALGVSTDRALEVVEIVARRA